MVGLQGGRVLLGARAWWQGSFVRRVTRRTRSAGKAKGWNGAVLGIGRSRGVGRDAAQQCTWSVADGAVGISEPPSAGKLQDVINALFFDFIFCC